MRSYPRNSPEAAGRIVALVLLADGHVSQAEMDVLERIGTSEALGLPPQAMAQIIQSLCDDLYTGLCVTGSVHALMDDDTLAALMREIDDPSLQRQVLDLAQAAAASDGHLAEAEVQVLNAAQRHWGTRGRARSAFAGTGETLLHGGGLR